MPMNDCCENEISQMDQARAFWQRLIAPELPDDLLTRLAFHFGTVRRTTATDAKRKIAAECNAALGRRIFIETVMGDLVFNE
jgi:hypothetical protein